MHDHQESISIMGENPIESSMTSKSKYASLPPTFLLSAHLSEAELHELEDLLIDHGVPLTFEMNEANLVIGNISSERRAKFELRCGKVQVEELGNEFGPEKTSASGDTLTRDPSKKRKRVDYMMQYSVEKPADLDVSSITGSTTSNVTEGEAHHDTKVMSPLPVSSAQKNRTSTLTEAREVQHDGFSLESFKSRVKVVKLDWFRDSIAAGVVRPFEPYTIYEARLVSLKDVDNSPISDRSGYKLPSSSENDPRIDATASVEIIKRARADAEAGAKPYFSRARNRDQTKEAANLDFAGRSFMSSSKSTSKGSQKNTANPPRLQHQTTSEHDVEIDKSLPPMPDWVQERKLYSCQRATPPESPNDEFIAQLKKIKLARLLTGDDIGVRAYSTSIASLAAYPYTLSSTHEILALPGCDQKIAQLFQEWRSTDGHIQAVADIDADPALKVLRVFYEIWGVGATTARDFYYNQGWRDLDDVIEHGWKSLTRVQQIGVKYYDEFQQKMSRTLVESIASTILRHACRLTDSKLEAIIVGGYRRGNSESSDVDIILSHPSERITLNLITAVVDALEDTGCITHVLTLALTNSNRQQQPLPLRSAFGAAGHGFDTLDKALVVWQDQDWPTKAMDLATDASFKNPNPHRRVDIIVSPWRTIGCAVEGWTSGTTFQRDLRRYAKKVKGWKFDSSGVRERGSGRWVDLEGWADEKTRCTDWREAERRVFEGMGLVYREPWERCTG